MKIKRSPSKKK